jgi:hypothetical protein
LSEIRRITAILQKKVSAKFPGSAQSCIGGFLFLRYFCPAVVTPVAFGVLKVQPNQDAQRGLTLIAKALQNIANGVTFGKKEEFLEFMNAFVDDNMLACQDYFDRVGILPLKPKPEMEVNIEDFKREKALKSLWKIAKTNHPKLMKIVSTNI